jgi:hypothetical protein
MAIARREVLMGIGIFSLSTIPEEEKRLMKLVKFTLPNGHLIYINPAEVVAVREVIQSNAHAMAKTEILCGAAHYDVQESLGNVAIALAGSV